MVKTKRRLRRGVYDLIIYTCLFGAIICLFLGSNSYIKTFQDEKATDVVKQVFLESPNPSNNEEIEKEVILLEEPPQIKDIEKSSIIVNYLEKIKDRIIKSEIVSYEEILTWSTYFVNDITYIKEITKDYYLYQYNISINKTAITSLPINESLSTEEYNVISLNVYLFNKDNNLIIKKIDPIK